MILKSSKRPELYRCVTKRLEHRFSANNSHLGEKLFVYSKLELAPFKAVEFSGWDDWERDPVNNRSWQWRLNWLSFLSYLMAYHRTSHNDAVLDFARGAIQSWLSAYLETDTSCSFEFIWHDHATALRVEQLVLFGYYCSIYAPKWAKENSDFLVFLEKAIEVHGEWLEDDEFYSAHTNHGLEQARVLLLLGTVFDGEQADEWQKTAIRRISSELDFSFTQEGVHVENSPAYHIFVFKVFLGIIKDYPEEVLGDLADQFNKFSVKALDFITHILRPDGKLPPIGDTEQLPTSDAYSDMFGHMPEYQHLRYALTKGNEGEVPPSLSRVYPQSGYAIFRNRWPSAKNYHLAFHLIAKVGCSSRYHHQQDEGHISVYAGGEDWLIDSGLYNYINRDPIRRYMRGRPGHNVPLISDAGYEQNFDHRLNAWKVVDYSEEEAHPRLAMQLDVLPPVTQVRRVDMDMEGSVLTVKDSFSSDDDKERTITLQWHVPKDKTVTVADQVITVESCNGNKMTLIMNGPCPSNISVAEGVKEGKVLSCISYKSNNYEASKVIKVVYEAVKSLEVSSIFDFQGVDKL